MSSAVSVQLLPLGETSLAVSGKPASSTTRTFSLAQTGTLRFSATAIQTPADPIGPHLGGKGGGGNPTQGPPPTLESVLLDYTLTDPKGLTFPRSSTGDYLITLATLAEYRDAAGLSTGVWTLHAANPSKSDILSSLSIFANLLPFPEPNLSPGPLVNNPTFPLQSGATATVNLSVDRIGNLQVAATPNQHASLTLTLLSPGGRKLATGTNSLGFAVSLRELHLIRREGTLCKLQIAAPPNLGNLTCNLSAQVHQAITLDDTVLQQRIDAVIGSSSTGNYVTAEIEYDSGIDRNVVYLTISEPAFTTLDNFGIIDTFEDNNLASQQQRFAANPAGPHPQRQFMDPGKPYAAFDFSASSIQVKNFKTKTITATMGGSMLTQMTPSLTFAVNFVQTVNGTNPQILSGGHTVELTKAPSVGLTLCILAVQGKLQVTVTDAKLGFESNLVNLPDFITWAECEHEPSVQIHDAYASFVASIPAAASPTLQTLFTTLMGGLFTFEAVGRQGASTSVFTYIPAAEPAPRTLDPSYLPRGAARPSPAPVWTSPNAAKIDHIVILMMENRSFDHVLGYLSLTAGRADIDGLSQAIISSFPAGAQPFLFKDTIFPFDPSHAFDSVKIQMGSDLSGKGPMRGFGLAFLQDYPFLAFAPDSPQRIARDDPYWYPQRKNFGLDAIMGYHNGINLPFFGILSREFVVCDRWYSSHPGPTFPNRFMYLSGHLAHDSFGEPMQDNDISSLRLLRESTIQDALTERNISWKVYESPPDVAMLRMYARYAFDDTNIRPISEFYTSARAGQLPSVTFLEPNFHVGVDTNDDHPPCDMHNGQALIQNVYQALTANKAAWNKTLFLICYDEHGGLYDHVYPDIADSVQAAGQTAIQTRYGVRVPAFVISPWAPRGTCTHTIFDHTSILKTIMMRFAPDDPALMSDRMAWANDFFQLLTLGAVRNLDTEANGQEVEHLSIAEDDKTAASTLAARETAAIPASVTKSASLRQGPFLRVKDLFKGQPDFHEYMGKLSTLVGPPAPKP